MFWTFVAALLFVSIIIPLLFYLGVFSVPLIKSIFSTIKDHKQSIKKATKIWGMLLIWFGIFIYSTLFSKGRSKELLGWILLLPIIWFIYTKIRDNLRLTKINKQKSFESKTTLISQ